MAKYEKSLKGNFNEFLAHLHSDITSGSISASFENGSSVTMGPVKMAFRVYERYSMTGGNRVSLSIVLVGNNDDLFLSAIASGGSQAVFFKINTFGEETFLDVCRKSVERYIRRKQPD